MSEVEEDLESKNEYPLRNHWDSLKVNFEQEDDKNWSDKENDAETDELMEWWKEDLLETMVNMMLEDDLNDLD